MARITLGMTTLDAIHALCEGNIGAVNVCARLLAKGGEIDPDAGLGGLGNLLALDTLNIYGSRIWVLYKDVCREDIVNLVGVLRANQLGYVSSSDLQQASDERSRYFNQHNPHVDVDALLAKVRERLPRFAKPVATNEARV